ncbi:MAG: hypothetical protein MJA83_13760 [Gammaproteobacteria bacterium]|nr:hypothetical protein [Gammaproteobacteria bacterium]
MAAHLPTVWLDDDGIIHEQYGQYAEITVDSIARSMSLIRRLTDRKAPILIHGLSVLDVQKEVEICASHPKVIDVTSALGILVGSFMSEYVAQMFIWYHRPPYPCKIFHSEEQASNWLKQYL